jgi:hypothetical protein
MKVKMKGKRCLYTVVKIKKFSVEEPHPFYGVPAEAAFPSLIFLKQQDKICHYFLF